MAYFEELPVGKLLITGGGVAGGTPVSATGLSVVHKQMGYSGQSVFTFNNFPITVPTANKYIGVLLYTFPKCLLGMDGAVATLTETTTSTIATTLTSAAGVFSIGSAAASSTTLTGTAATFLASTAITPSATIAVAGTKASAQLASGPFVDGTTTAVPVYLNLAFTSMSTADATTTWTGQIVLSWNNLGAYL